MSGPGNVSTAPEVPMIGLTTLAGSATTAGAPGTVAAVPATATAATVPGAPAVVADPASVVNPIIGTSGAVDTFPGPDMPFGMMQWSPDTSPSRPNGGGYEYNNSKISGFSMT